jgi:hypothetical protein
MPHRHLHAPVRPRPVSHAEAIRALIAERTPNAEAKARVTISAPHARSAYLAYTRLSGARDDVLDYAAYLFATDTGRGVARLDVDAVERDADGELTLLLSRSLYEAP